MEAAEVPESTTKLIIGHKRVSLTYGHYSKGDRLKLRKYIDKVHYSDDVMRLIRAPRRQMPSGRNTPVIEADEDARQVRRRRKGAAKPQASSRSH
jgi:hypothetical protein